jgi:hypothetical protein
MPRTRALTAKDLEIIDDLAAFIVKSDRNAELTEMMVKLHVIIKVPGAAEVLSKRQRELARVKRDAAK